MGQFLIPAQQVTFLDQDLSGIISAITDLRNRVSKLEQPPLTTPQPSIAIPPILFSPISFLNTKLDPNAPLHARNADFMAYLTKGLRTTNAWIASDTFGAPIFLATDKDPIFPIFDVEPTHTNSPLTFLLAKGINLPFGLTPALGTDGHCSILLVSSTGPWKLYGFWKLQFNNNRWECRAIEYLENFMQADGTTQDYQGWWNTATASHISLPAGLIRKVDIDAMHIPHALAMSVPNCSPSFVFPARSSDGWDKTDPSAFPMGTRFRLPADIIVNPAWCPMTRMLVEAARDYGTFVRDTTQGNSTDFYMEDMRQYGVDMHAIWMKLLNWDGTGTSGPPIWKVMGNKNVDGEFPFSKLEVLA